MAKQKRLGELLLEAGLINEAQLAGALERQKKWGGRFGENLILNNAITEDQLLRFFAARTGIDELDITGVQVLPHIIKKVPAKLAEKHHIMPVAMKDKNTLMVAVCDPMDFEAMDQVRFTTGLKVEPVLSSYSAIANAIDKFYHDGRGVFKGAKSKDSGGPRMVKAESMESHGGKQSSDDPDLIIFGEQHPDQAPPKGGLADISGNYKSRERTSDNELMDLDRTVPEMSLPLPQVPDMGMAGKTSGQSGQVSRQASRPASAPRPPAAPSSPGTPASKKSGRSGFTIEEKFRALYNAMVRKGLITEQEMKQELLRLRQARKP